MKLSCEIIRDLLPLYEDGVCSEKSREAVKDHLDTCRDCAALAGKQLPQLELPETAPEERAIAKSFRKVRRRWALSLVIVLVALPVLYMLGKFGWNEYRKEGICFSNLDTVWDAENFADALENGDFQAVADSMDYTMDYESIQSALAMTVEDLLPDVVRTRIGGMEYWAYIPDDMVKRCQEPDFWQDVVFNGWYRALIPEDVFWQTVKDCEYFDDGIGICLMGGYSFYPVELKWGKYYVNQSYYTDIMLRKDDALELCHVLELWPEAIYEEAKPLFEAEAVENWQASQEWNAPYADMSLEEYNVLRRERLVQDLEALQAQGLQLENKGVEYAYHTEGRWTVQMAILMQTPEGDERIDLELRETGDHLTLTGTGINGERRNPWYDALIDAFC